MNSISSFPIAKCTVRSAALNIAWFTHISSYPEIIREGMTSAVVRMMQSSIRIYFPNKSKDIQKHFHCVKCSNRYRIIRFQELYFIITRNYWIKYILYLISKLNLLKRKQEGKKNGAKIQSTYPASKIPASLERKDGLLTKNQVIRWQLIS